MTPAARDLLAHIERLDYSAYQAAQELMEDKGGGDWPEALALIEAQAVAQESGRGMLGMIDAARVAIEALDGIIAAWDPPTSGGDRTLLARRVEEARAALAHLRESSAA